MELYMTDILIKTDAYHRNPYGIHKILWELFPDQADKKRDFLFRATPSLDGKLHITMQSPQRPELSRLSGNTTAEVLTCSRHSLDFEPGQIYQFVLLANPTSKRDNKLVPINYQHGLKQWIARRLEQAALIESVVAIIHPSFEFIKEGVAGRVHQVLFAGFLRISDNAHMKSVVAAGIGRSKFLGFGLLTLRGPYDPHGTIAAELDAAPAEQAE